MLDPVLEPLLVERDRLLDGDAMRIVVSEVLDGTAVATGATIEDTDTKEGPIPTTLTLETNFDRHVSMIS